MLLACKDTSRRGSDAVGGAQPRHVCMQMYAAAYPVCACATLTGDARQLSSASTASVDVAVTARHVAQGLGMSGALKSADTSALAALTASSGAYTEHPCLLNRAQQSDTGMNVVLCGCCECRQQCCAPSRGSAQLAQHVGGLGCAHCLRQDISHDAAGVNFAAILTTPVRALPVWPRQ